MKMEDALKRRAQREPTIARELETRLRLAALREDFFSRDSMICDNSHKLAKLTTTNWPRMAGFDNVLPPNPSVSKDKMATSCGLQALIWPRVLLHSSRIADRPRVNNDSSGAQCTGDKF